MASTHLNILNKKVIALTIIVITVISSIVGINISKKQKRTVVQEEPTTLAENIDLEKPTSLTENISKKGEDLAQQQKVIDNYMKRIKGICESINMCIIDLQNYSDLILNVWYNTEYQISDTKTDKYTKQNSLFNSDVHESIDALFSDEDFKKNLVLLQEHRDLISSVMKNIENPPTECNDAYDLINGYYYTYLDFADLVSSPPSDSYSSYASELTFCSSMALSYTKSIREFFDDNLKNIIHTRLCVVSGCCEEGIYSWEGFGGTEYYCSKHYNEMIDMALQIYGE